MKILFVASRFPFPPLKGDQVRGYHQLKHLSQRHQIDLVALSSEPVTDESVSAIKPFVRKLIIVKHGRGNQISGVLRGILSSMPLQTCLNENRVLNATLRTWRQETRYDIALVQLARLAGCLPALGNLPVVLDLIDALSLNMKRRFESDKSLLRYAAWLEWKRMVRLERALCTKCSCALVVGKRDSEAIGGERPPHPVVLGVDTEVFKPGIDSRSGIIFSGNLGYFPNYDAARIMVEDVMPLLWKNAPDLRLTIAGTNPPQALRSAASGRPVDITGRVPELAPYIAKAAAAVFPLRAGSGMQFKVLEAFACKTPVVMTPAAVAGFHGDVQDGTHALIAESPQDIAAATQRVLNDQGLAQRLSDNGLQLIRAKYNWSVAAREIESIFSAIVTGGEAARSSTVGAQ